MSKKRELYKVDKEMDFYEIVAFSDELQKFINNSKSGKFKVTIHIEGLEGTNENQD